MKKKDMVTVDIGKLSQGLNTTFRGVAEIFEAIGAEENPGFNAVEEAAAAGKEAVKDEAVKSEAAKSRATDDESADGAVTGGGDTDAAGAVTGAAADAATEEETTGSKESAGAGDSAQNTSITSQCCGNAEIELGTVYASELDISLFSTIDRYTLQDALVEMFYHLVLPDESVETVPMGLFEVSEANRKVKTLEIKAYDFMVRFEKSFNASESIGNCYDFMTLCSLACDVALAQTREYIEALPNGTENLSIYEDNDIETYRDVLYYIGQVLGGFFVINRSGALELRKYGNVPTLLVERKHRFTSSFSDFITRYTAVSSTNLRTQIAEYYALDPDDGLTMNLGVNPFLQFGLDETREQLITNILNDIAVVNYVPFETDTIGNPALDLGDILSFSGGQADSTKIAAITSNTVKIGGRQTLKCVGKNPRLAQAKSKGRALA